MKDKQTAFIGLSIWLVFVFSIMVLTRIVDIEIFFVVGYLGLLVTMKLMTKRFVQPSYVQYFSDLIIIGIAVFAVITVQKTIGNILINT